MADDYSKFKTPIHTLKVFNGADFVPIPTELSRLITRVQIVETVAVKKNENTLTITFTEGSRKIFPTNQMTNEVGAVLDAKFLGSDRKFIFSAGNMLQVTWGYAEDRFKQRSLIFRIVSAEVSYSDSQQVTTKLTCKDASILLSKRVSKKGIALLSSITVKRGNTLQVTKSTAEVLRELDKKIFDGNGIISTSFKGDPPDRNHVIPIGTSLRDWLDDRAEKHNAFWRVVSNGTTEKLIFLNKEDLYKQPLFADSSAFTFKAAGSIIKDIKISFDIGERGDEVAAAVMNADGEVQTTKVDLKKVEEQLDSDKKVDSNLETSVGSTGSFLKKLEGILVEPLKGIIEYSANLEVNGDINETTSSQHKQISGQVLSASITTLGFSHIIPGTINIQKIGKRLSGHYRVETVTHTIDNTGYFCKIAAVRPDLGSKEGVSVIDSVKGAVSNKVEEDLDATPKDNKLSGKLDAYKRALTKSLSTVKTNEILEE